MSAPPIDLTDLREALLDNIAGLAEVLLGPCNRRLSTRRTWRWGAKGSLALEVSGPKRGRWYSHEAGEGGGVIEFVRHGLRCSRAEAVAWSADFTGLSAGTDAERARHEARDEQRQKERAQREAVRAAEDAADDAARIADARRRLQRTRPIMGTIAERYLTETRGIPHPLSGWPDVLRFDAGERALVVVATGSDGEPQAAQWVHLTDDAHKAEPTKQRPTKQTRGVLRGAAVRLPGRPGAPLQTAEGPETGLSVWVSTGCETWIALGGIRNLPPPPQGREVVACVDDDGRHTKAARDVRKTLGRWRRHGVKFVAAKPWAARREDGSDFNDLLQTHGTGAVEERILLALEPGYRTREPVPVAMARFRLRRAIHAEADAVLAGSTEGTKAIGTGAGGGKTTISHEEAVRVIHAWRGRDDKRTIAIATPRHDLNDEQAGRLSAIAPDLAVAVYRGADAPNPYEPATKMCRNLRDRKEALIRRLDPGQMVCPACPYRSGCAYLAQASRRADIWLVPHSLIFHRKPAALGDLGWLIIDENPVAAALLGAGDSDAPDEDDRPLVLTLDTLKRPDKIGNDPVATNRLHEIRRRLIQALESSPDTRLMRVALTFAGLTADMIQEAISLEYSTKIMPEIRDDMSLEERLEAIRAADANADLGRRVMLLQDAAALLHSRKHDESSRTELVTLHETVGAVRALRLKGRRTIKAGWQAHTTIIDATLQPDLLRPIWPDLTVEEIGRIAAPHRHIVQVMDRAFSLAMLDADDPRIG